MNITVFALIRWYSMLFDSDTFLKLCNGVLWELQQAIQSLMKECKKNALISSEYDEMHSQHHMRGIINLANNKPIPLPTP